MTSFLAASIVILLFVHLGAALLGAGSITVAEWRYFRALLKGHISTAERAHLVGLFFSLRFALVIVMLVNIALAFALYNIPGAPAITLTAPYWFQTLVIVLLIIASWLRYHGKIPFWLGSAVAFTGWWYLLGLDLGYVPVAGFGSAAVGFMVSVAVVAALFEYARFMVRSRSKNA